VALCIVQKCFLHFGLSDAARGLQASQQLYPLTLVSSLGCWANHGSNNHVALYIITVYVKVIEHFFAHVKEADLFWFGATRLIDVINVLLF